MPTGARLPTGAGDHHGSQELHNSRTQAGLGVSAAKLTTEEKVIVARQGASHESDTAKGTRPPQTVHVQERRYTCRYGTEPAAAKEKRLLSVDSDLLCML